MKPILSRKWLIATAAIALLALLGVWSVEVLALTLFVSVLAGAVLFMTFQRRINAEPLLKRALSFVEDDRVAFEFDPDRGRLHIRAGQMSLHTAYAVVDSFRIASVEAEDRFSPEVEACLANDYEWTEHENISVWTRTRFHW